MTGWTSIEQVARMAAELTTDENYVDTSLVNVTLRRVTSPDTEGPRWTATISPYSSKAARTPEEAIEEVAGMFRGALLCRIERAEKRLERARAALPTDAPTPTGGEERHG
jgi:hypothetical protein